MASQLFTCFVLTTGNHKGQEEDLNFVKKKKTIFILEYPVIYVLYFHVCKHVNSDKMGTHV